MDFIHSYLQFVSAYYYAAAVLLLLLILILGYILYRRHIRKRLKREAKACAELHPAFRSSCSFSLSRRLLSLNFKLLRNLSQRYGLNLVVLTRLDDYWIKKIESKPTKRLFRRALNYSPEKSLFPCFEASLEKKRFQSVLREWMDKSGEFMIMRSIAGSCGGRRFDGETALEAYGDFKDELYEMAGDHDWKHRWFAYSILVHDEEKRSRRALWEAFSDTSARVRETAAELFAPYRQVGDAPAEKKNPEATEKRAEAAKEEGEKLRNRLYRQLLRFHLDDPEYRVRKRARERIERDFSDLYAIPKELSYIQKLHLAEFLNPELEKDRSFAFTLLDSEDEELTFEAARLLSKAGSLKKLFLDVFHEDRRTLERASELLLHAARVHCSDFLSSLAETNNPGSLLLATKILSKYGDRTYISSLVQKVRAFTEGQKMSLPLREVYREGLLCACVRGDDTALHILAHELKERSKDTELHREILEALPVERAHVFITTLVGFLRSPDYTAKEQLRTTLSRIEPSFVLPHLFEIIKSDDTSVDPRIQEEALKVLCELKLPYTVQHLLEHLPLLSVSQANRYTALISSYNRTTYTERVAYLLETKDARIRSRIIASLPKELFPEFRDTISGAVTDADPEVRSACAWSIVNNGSKEEQRRVIDLLHDPVHGVRTEAARAIAGHNAADHHGELEELLEDPNELLPVKRSAVEGLAESRDEKSVDLLVSLLSAETELEGELIRALSRKSGTAMVTRILSHVEKADQKLRTLLTQALKSMGESAESVLESLIFDMDSTLRDVTVDILEKIGSVDSRIRHLSNRDVSVRREAAAFLAQVGTKSAYRGLVLAAKDPDEDVRGYVVRALDALDSDKGQVLLESLREDPDRRVRSLTEWALERHKARRL